MTEADETKLNAAAMVKSQDDKQKAVKKEKKKKSKDKYPVALTPAFAE